MSMFAYECESFWQLLHIGFRSPGLGCALEQPEYPLGGHRQVRRADTDGVLDGAGDGGWDAPDWWLPDPPRPQRALAFAALDDLDEHIGKVLRIRDQVVGEQSRLHVTVLEDDVFGERVAEALHGASLDLPFHTHRVDGTADVVACRVPEYRDLTGVDVDLHIGRVRAVGVVGERGALPGPRVERAGFPPPRRQVRGADGPLPAGGGQFRQRHAHSATPARPVPAKARGAGRPDPAVREHQLIGRDAEQVRRHRRHPLAKLAGRLQHRVPRHVELTGGERTPGRRVERAVADVDADVIKRNAEHLGGDLAQAGRLPGA